MNEEYWILDAGCRMQATGYGIQYQVSSIKDPASN
jgi:hypothetical protein